MHQCRLIANAITEALLYIFILKRLTRCIVTSTALLVVNATHVVAHYCHSCSQLKALLSSYAQGCHTDYTKYTFFNEHHYVRNFVDGNDEFELMVRRDDVCYAVPLCYCLGVFPYMIPSSFVQGDMLGTWSDQQSPQSRQVPLVGT